MTLTAFVAVSGLTAAAIATASLAAVAAPATGCQPGSGRQLAGHHFTNGEISNATTYLRCANLTGADFSGVSLAQVDLTAALLRNANMQHADLTQATLNRADLSGANLTGATMTQVTARNAKLVGANLTSVDLSQADLTGSDLSHANISGTSFGQATLDGTKFTGVTGVAPWSLYLEIAAGVLFVLLVLGTIRRRLQVTGRGRSRYAISTTSRRPVSLARGLIAAVLIAFGFHLFAGGLIDLIMSASGPPLAQTCTAGPLCTVGVGSGFVGLFVGVFIVTVGIIARAASGKSSQAFSVAGSGGPFGPGGPFTFGGPSGGPPGSGFSGSGFAGSGFAGSGFAGSGGPDFGISDAGGPVDFGGSSTS